MQIRTRRQFLAACAALGIGTALAACSDDDDSSTSAGGGGSSDEHVIIVGAGAAGMSAAHLLAQRGISFEILEAGPTHGGRIRHDLSFTDFPIPLGAEWLHGARHELPDIVNDPDVDVTTVMREYESSDSYGLVTDGELSMDTLGTFRDLKFVGSSWLDFFETYVVPGIEGAMVFGTQIVRIDDSADGPVVLTDAAGGTHEADHVIVTVPMKILQDGDIEFVPALPDTHLDALDAANIWSGLKVFLEFTEAFYPVFLESTDDEERDGQRAYYDAAYGQDTDANILGLFLVGDLAEEYMAEADLLARILGELDALFDGAASRTYVQHLVQNWNDEPYARAAYLEDYAPSWVPKALGQSISDQVHFAGDGYTREDNWSEVHVAARSARAAVDEIFG